MLHPLLIATPIKFRFKFGYEVIFHCSSGYLVIRTHFVEGHDIEFMPASLSDVHFAACTKLRLNLRCKKITFKPTNNDFLSNSI